MTYQEFIPAAALKPYVKCYYLYESDTDAIREDKAFATGCLEIMFNLGNGKWQTTSADGDFQTTPLIELWGQIIEPLTFRSLGSNTMLGIRFHPHTAAIFLDAPIYLFNNRVSSFPERSNKPIRALHTQLLDTASLQKKIELIESFLLMRLSLFEKKFDKISLLNDVIRELKHEDSCDNINNLASRYGISSRYLQKLFVQYTGLTPKLYNKIHRFQNSLLLVAKRNTSLTAVAYECGYFDQSHFIREFKSFTGSAPSAFLPENSSAILASPNK